MPPSRRARSSSSASPASQASPASPTSPIRATNQPGVDLLMPPPPPYIRRRRNAINLDSPSISLTPIRGPTRNASPDSASPPPLRERVERRMRQMSSRQDISQQGLETVQDNTPTPSHTVRRRRILFGDEDVIPTGIRSASFEKAPSTTKTPISTPTESPTLVHASCVSQLEGLHPKFKNFSRKFKRICTALSEECVNFDEQKQALVEAYVRVASQTPESYRQYNDIDPDHVIASVFNKWLRTDELSRKRMLVVQYRDLYVTYKGQQGIGEGVTRSFVQKLIDELSSENIFAPYQDGASKRYFVSHTFQPSQDFQRIAGITFEREEHYAFFYEFIGHLLMFIVFNDIGLPFHLSHAILAHMVYRHEEIDADDYLGYYLMDFPDEAVGILNLMREKDIQTIGLVGIEVNDDFDLIEENAKSPAMEQEVNADNYLQYLQLRAKHRELHFVHPRDNRPKNAVDTYPRFLGLSKGFLFMRKLLRRQRVSIPMLDKLITYSAMDENIVKAFAQRYKQAMEDRFRDMALPRSDINRRTFQHMLTILRDGGDKFPYEEIGASKPADPMEQRRIFYTFIEKLLLFWSSLRYFNPDFAYITSVVSTTQFETSIRTMRRNQRDYLTFEEQQNILPESHTCYTRLDIPVSYADDLNTIYRKLVTATFNVEPGIGNLGGARKRRPSSKK